MKRMIILTPLCAVLLAGSLTAQDQPPMKDKTPPRPAMMHKAMGLNLTDEQQAKVDDLRLKQLKEMQPLMADLQKQESTLKLEVTADKYNESKVKSILAEISKIQNDLASKRVLHHRAMRDILTPEQQKKFDAGFLANGGPGGRGRMMGMRGGMGMMPGMRMGMGQGMHPGMGMGMGQGMHPGMGMGMEQGMPDGKGKCPTCGMER